MVAFLFSFVVYRYDKRIYICYNFSAKHTRLKAKINMIIDFHTHIFADALAPKALTSLKESSKGLYEPVHDMTYNGLIKSMDACGVDKSVVLPILTKQTQTVKVNEWAASVNEGRIVAFGSIYPRTDDYRRDIDFVCSLGLKGIKLHAEYQDFFVDDAFVLPIYDYAFSKGLMIVHHAGYDPISGAVWKSSPQRFARVLDQIKGGVMVAAHLGGEKQWDDVEKYLVGRDIYLDTSMGSRYYPRDQFLRIVKNHGSDRILFASDSPWSNAAEEIDYIKGLPIDEADKYNIFFENAKRLLRNAD